MTEILKTSFLYQHTYIRTYVYGRLYHPYTESGIWKTVPFLHRECYMEDCTILTQRVLYGRLYHSYIRRECYHTLWYLQPHCHPSHLYRQAATGAGSPRWGGWVACTLPSRLQARRKVSALWEVKQDEGIHTYSTLT